MGSLDLSPRHRVLRDLSREGNLTADANIDLDVPMGAKGCTIVADYGTVTGTLDIKLQHLVPGGVIDGETSVAVDIHGAAMTQVTTSNDDQAHYMTVYPGVAETAGQTVSDALSGKIRVVLDVTTGPIPVAIVLTWLF